MKQLCIHTITTKPWQLQEALDNYCKQQVGGISIWQDAVQTIGTAEAGKLIAQYPIEVVSYVRGGFFPHATSEHRQKAITHNKQMLDEAADIGAPMLVLVSGAEPSVNLNESRKQIQAGIEAILPHAQAVGVKLAIEPLHPMYADTRSAINTLKQANDMAVAINSDFVGVALDVYHVWWDDTLEQEIERCGALNKLFAFHICDWKVPTNDILLDRGLMGEGCIDLKAIKHWVNQAGFDGFHEVEIFSNIHWAKNQHQFLAEIIAAYQDYSALEAHVNSKTIVNNVQTTLT